MKCYCCQAPSRDILERVSRLPSLDVITSIPRGSNYTDYAGRIIIVDPDTRRYTTSLEHLFEFLQLDLEELSQIFVNEPDRFYTIPEDQRPRQPIAASYRDLSCSCENLGKINGKMRLLHADNSDGWSRLSAMFNKPIQLVEQQPSWDSGFMEWKDYGTFYPDGSFKEADVVSAAT